jgi:hypothetical protein
LFEHGFAKVEPSQTGLVAQPLAQGEENIPTTGGKVENIYGLVLFGMLNKPVAPKKIDPTG